MKVITEEISFNTKHEGDVLDITESVQQVLTSKEVYKGVVTLFVAGSTGALTTIEFEPGLSFDFPAMLERIAPKEIDYEHENLWHDGNGHSHVRASLIGPSLTVPFSNQRLTLGTWQQIVFIELDVRARKRKIIVQILGE
jgi:secondary thiamine-phosphate synthase enzyme